MHDLLEPQLIGLDEADGGVDPQVQSDVVASGALAHHRQPVLEGLADGERGAFEVHASGLDLGEVEDLAEEVQEVLPRAPDVAEVLLLTVVDLAEHAVEQHLREPDHGVERGAQLVRHAGEELGLVPADHLQLAGLVLQLAEQTGVEDRQRRIGWRTSAAVRSVSSGKSPARNRRTTSTPTMSPSRSIGTATIDRQPASCSNC